MKLKTHTKYYLLQQQELQDGTLPFSYVIYRDGSIGRQDFWKGSPTGFIGFADKPVAGNMKYTFEDFLKIGDYTKASGLYPIFEGADGGWYTKTNPIKWFKMSAEE